jgi:hypothetical protein
MFIVSPLPRPQPPGQGSGPAACNGHRQPHPDTRHCERHDHGDGDDQAVGARSSGSPGVAGRPQRLNFRCVPVTLHSHPRTSNRFLEFWIVLLDLPGQPRPGAAVHGTRPGRTAARRRRQPGNHRTQHLQHRHRPGRGRLHRQAQDGRRSRYQIQCPRSAVVFIHSVEGIPPLAWTSSSTPRAAASLVLHDGCLQIAGLDDPFL